LKSLFITLVTLGALSTVSAQVKECPYIPEEYSWETPEDYARDSALVRRCLEWLCEADLREEFQSRSNANAFVMIWLSNSPWIQLDINSDALAFMPRNPDLFFVFTHGMALHKMTHPTETGKIKLHAEGLKVVASLVKENDALRKEDYLKPILKASRSEKKLKKYVTALLD